MSTSPQCYIGRVKRAPHRGDVYHYASIEPLVESDPAGAEWVGPVHDAVTRFPKRGLVHWHDAPLAVEVGSLWQFTIDEHPAADRGDRSEQFQLEDVREPIEVVDLRAWGDEVALRSAITGDGVPLTPAPAARRLLLWLASGLCVGPLLLKAATDPGLWVLDAPEAHRDAARMPVSRLAVADINRVPIDGGRWFVSPPLDAGRSAGIQNWTSDAQVARSILARLRKLDPDVVKAIGVTDNLFREYLDRVEAGRLGSADPAVERARADRLRGVREAIQRDATLLLETADSLLTTAAVRADIDRQVRARVAEDVLARQVEVEAAVAASNEQLTRIQGDLEAKLAEIASLDAALCEKRDQLEAKVASFDQEVAARLEEIARKPEALFAETAVMRALLAPALSVSVNGNGTAGAAPSVRLEMDFGQAAQELAEDSEVRGALYKHAGAAGLSIHSMVALHAAFIAGVAPVVIGSRGYELIRAYAAAAAGGRLHWIPVGSSVIEPQDLLGRYDQRSGRIVPSASGLLDVLRDATESGRLHVVVLDGFNRAPSEAYLSPILDAVQASRLGDAARVIPLANPSVVSDDDQYRGLARLAWPPSVVIAALPTEGSATLPVSPTVWRHLALLDADDRDRTSAIAMPAPGDIAPRTEISRARWNTALTEIAAHAVDEFETGAALERALSLSGHDLRDAARLREGMLTNGVPADDASDLAITAILIARSGADAKKIQDTLHAAGAAAPGWRTSWAEALRLRS